MSTTDDSPPRKRSIGAHIYSWLDERMGLHDIIIPIIVHPVPKTNWWYVFGSATLIAFIVQVVTGVALAMTYVPAPVSAYESLQFITHEALLGSVVRGLHYWGASAMVVLIGIHAVRVFLMGSFKYPREVNWVTGTFLLLLTLAMAFTGQLLRWDQTAYWSIAVAASQVGRVPLLGDWLVQVVVAGKVIGGATLTRFYATHVFLIPALMFMLVGLHLYLVVKDGISEPPEPGRPVRRATYRQEYNRLLETNGQPFFPDAAWKDVVFGLGVVLVLLALALIVGPPELDAPPDPTVIQAYPRPDWYFLSYFAVLALLPTRLETVVIVGFPLLVGFLLLVVPFIANEGERAPSRRPWAVGIVAILLLSVGVLTRAGLEAPWSPVMHPDEVQPIPPQVVATASPSVLRGATLFQEEACLSCHMVAGAGGRRGPDLTHAGSRLSREQLTWRILYGGNNMPAYSGNLTPEQLEDLLTFLESLK